MRILCVAAKQGPSILFCMAKQDRLYRIGLSDGKASWQPLGHYLLSVASLPKARLPTLLV
jgi:hypothetical protein